MPCYCLLMLTCGKFADVIIFRPRGYIRHAEALLALGPDQHALEASQTVAKALAATKPGEDAAAHLRGWRMLWQPQLQALHVRTKAAACCWGAVKPNPASPDDALDDALQTLSRLIVAGLAIAKEPDVAMLAYGRNVVAAVSTVAAILRAAYADPTWVSDQRYYGGAPPTPCRWVGQHHQWPLGVCTPSSHNAMKMLC